MFHGPQSCTSTFTRHLQQTVAPFSTPLAPLTTLEQFTYSSCCHQHAHSFHCQLIYTTFSLSAAFLYCQQHACSKILLHVPETCIEPAPQSRHLPVQSYLDGEVFE